MSEYSLSLSPSSFITLFLSFLVPLLRSLHCVAFEIFFNWLFMHANTVEIPHGLCWIRSVGSDRELDFTLQTIDFLKSLL